MVYGALLGLFWLAAAVLVVDVVGGGSLVVVDLVGGGSLVVVHLVGVGGLVGGGCLVGGGRRVCGGRQVCRGHLVGRGRLVGSEGRARGGRLGGGGGRARGGSLRGGRGRGDQGGRAGGVILVAGNVLGLEGLVMVHHERVVQAKPSHLVLLLHAVLLVFVHLPAGHVQRVEPGYGLVLLLLLCCLYQGDILVVEGHLLGVVVLGVDGCFLGDDVLEVDLLHQQNVAADVVHPFKHVQEVLEKNYSFSLKESTEFRSKFVRTMML